MTIQKTLLSSTFLWLLSTFLCAVSYAVKDGTVLQFESLSVIMKTKDTEHVVHPFFPKVNDKTFA